MLAFRSAQNIKWWGKARTIFFLLGPSPLDVREKRVQSLLKNEPRLNL
jgi:hypothetical protein